MSKKAVLWVLVLSLPVMNASCLSHRIEQEKVGKIERWQNSRAEIFAIQKTTGEHIEFSREVPAGISNGCVLGLALQETVVDRTQLKRFTVDSGGKLLYITDQSGQTSQVLYGKIEGDKVRYITSASPTLKLSVPLSEIELVWVKRVNPWPTVAIVSAAAAVAVILAVDAASEPVPAPTTGEESCPFIYSFDGREYLFDAEPYGGSICKGLERTEWLGLDYLRPADGQYKIIVANELEESQFTDELKLLVVDHRVEDRIVPGIQGKLHTISDPVALVRAHDQRGKDIRPLVSQKDNTFWVGPLEGKDPERPQDLKDELIIEFPKPVGARQVKLVANAWTTVQGSQVAKTFLGLHGDAASAWLEEVNEFGPAYYWMWNWYSREDMYLMKIWVLTQAGWMGKAMMYGGGPFLAKDKAYPLDISDVPGDSLKIKLTPASGFWMIDYLAADYGADASVEVTELSPIRAVDRQGRDVRESLTADDGLYLGMPNIGDYAEVIFQAPNPREGLARSLILKATGYYDIRLKATGIRQEEALHKMDEPGYSIQLAMREFLKARGTAGRGKTE
jgi:hypothetical protein